MWGKGDTTEPKELKRNEKGEILDPSKAGAKPWVTKTVAERAMERIKAIEDGIYVRNLSILDASTEGSASYDDDEDKASVTAEEIATHGSIQNAIRYKRTALDNRKTLKSRPGYLTTAERIVASIARSRASASKSGGDGNTNTVNVFFQQNVTVYDEKEVTDHEDDK